MRRIFSWQVFLIAVVLLAGATVVKIHSVLSYPKESNRSYSNLKRIDKNVQNYSFAVFGDNKNSIRVYNDLTNHVNSSGALFSLNLGDLVFDGNMSLYSFYLKQARRFHAPHLTAIGNHDIYAGGRGNYYDIFGSFYYSFSVGPAYFIVLDNAAEQTIEPSQFKWLERELAKSDSFKYKFVGLHTPLYSPRYAKQGLEKGMGNRAMVRRLTEMFDSHDVTLIMTSHVHAFESGIWGKTPYIITGGAGAEIGGRDPAHYFFHYIKVNVGPDGVSWEVVKLKSPGLKAIDRYRYDLGLYVYAFLTIHYMDLVLTLTGAYLLAFLIWRTEKLWNRRQEAAGGAGSKERRRARRKAGDAGQEAPPSASGVGEEEDET